MRGFDTALGGINAPIQNQVDDACPDDIDIQIDFKDAPGDDSEFEKKTCFNETCLLFRIVINWIGAILAMIGAGLDITYALKSIFYAKVLYILASIFVASRFLVNFAIAQIFFQKHVTYFKIGLSQSDQVRKSGIEDDTREDGKIKDIEYKEIRN